MTKGSNNFEAKTITQHFSTFNFLQSSLKLSRFVLKCAEF